MTSVDASSGEIGSPKIPSSVPATGFPIPIKAAFSGFKGVDWLAVGRNNYNPILVLYDDAIEVRVFRRERQPYTAIEYVDVRQGWATNLLVIAWRDSVSTFSANLGYLGGLAPPESLREVLRFFESKQVPLSPRAQLGLHRFGAENGSDGVPIFLAATVSARLIANLMDVFVLPFGAMLVALLVLFAFSLLSKADENTVGFIFPACFIVLSALFEASRLQGTPGKRLVGLMVTDTHGARLRLARACLRALVKVAVSPLSLIAAPFTHQPGLLWHDTLTGTRVVERGSIAPANSLHGA